MLRFKLRLARISAYTSAAVTSRMAHSTLDEESLEIEVLRNVGQLQTSSTCTLDTPGSISDLSLICCKGTGLVPTRARGNAEQKNGCCHSTPLIGSAANNMQLKDYFGRLSLPVVSFCSSLVLKIMIH